MKRILMWMLAGVLMSSMLLGSLGMSVGKVSATSSEIANYTFEGNAEDSSGFENDGTVHGGVSFADGGAVFDGTSGYVELPANLIKDHTQLKVSVRFKTSDSGPILGYQNVPVSGGGQPTGFRFFISITTANCEPPYGPTTAPKALPLRSR